MTGLEALQSVQFVTKKGKRFAVLSERDWKSVLNWLEKVEDIQIALHAFKKLKAAGGNRKRAGWLKWEDVEAEIK